MYLVNKNRSRGYNDSTTVMGGAFGTIDQPVRMSDDEILLEASRFASMSIADLVPRRGGKYDSKQYKGHNAKHGAERNAKHNRDRDASKDNRDKYDFSHVDVEYKTIISRQQFKTIMTSDAKNALLSMMHWTYPQLDPVIIDAVIADNIDNDEIIYDKLNELVLSTPRPMSQKRGSNRVKDINYIFRNNFPLQQVKKYLDFGGGDGSITQEVAAFLGLKKDSAFLADVPNWLSGTQEYKDNDNVSFVALPGDGTIPLGDASFDFISCFVVLHHVEALERTIAELYRIMRPGGYLLVREHDCNSIASRMMIDIHHMLYTLVGTEKPFKEAFDKYAAYYKDKREWTRLIKSAGFTYYDKLHYKQPRGEMRIYYAVYRK